MIYFLNILYTDLFSEGTQYILVESETLEEAAVSNSLEEIAQVNVSTELLP